MEQGTRYINLMQARYGDGRLRVSVDIDFEVRDSMVPPFILQPLLENCIKHAQRETEPLSIRVGAFETDDGLEIIVEDDGIGMSEEVCAHLFEQHRREEPESITATAPSSEVAAWRSLTYFSASISFTEKILACA